MNCKFINNHVFYLNSYETGGAILLNTIVSINLTNSFFIVISKFSKI